MKSFYFVINRDANYDIVDVNNDKNIIGQLVPELDETSGEKWFFVPAEQRMTLAVHQLEEIGRRINYLELPYRQGMVRKVISGWPDHLMHACKFDNTHLEDLARSWKIDAIDARRFWLDIFNKREKSNS